jgi:hypothetical protein
MKHSYVVLLFVLPLFGFTCGNRKPIVANQLSRPIHVMLTWENGKPVEDELPPGGRAFLSDPPHHPQQVVISLPDGESYTFTKLNAPELIGHPVTGHVVGWKVTGRGVSLLLEGELKELDAQEPN